MLTNAVATLPFTGFHYLSIPFIVVLLSGVPVPPFPGNPLDPPLRSRQAGQWPVPTLPIDTTAPLSTVLLSTQVQQSRGVTIARAGGARGVSTLAALLRAWFCFAMFCFCMASSV